MSGENITDESPIFVSNNTRWNSRYEHLTNENLQMIISKVIKGAKIPRIKQGHTYNKSVIYMFRKRYNTILKINNDVNSNIAEKLIGHKRGLDGTYLQPTREECFAEFSKAIPELTIDDSTRKQIELEQANKEKSQLQEKVNEIDKLKAQQKIYELQHESDKAEMKKLIIDTLKAQKIIEN